MGSVFMTTNNSGQNFYKYSICSVYVVWRIRILIIRFCISISTYQLL